MSQPPGAHGEQYAGGYQRAARHQQRWGLLVEDEFKTDGADLIQIGFRSLVATLFYLAASVTHDVVISGREHVSGYHPTILLSNHKRDLDSLVVASVAYFARGISRPDTRLIYALREDAFWPGFLNYLQLPWPLGRLLSSLNVRAPIFLIKGYPMGYVTARTDLPRIQRQLRLFGELLDRGRDLYWTPEGGLTLDGRLSRFRAGFHRIVQESHAPLHLLPMAVIYDFMTTGRTRCFIRIGPEIGVDRGLARPELERQAHEAILRQMTITIGHLAAAVLRDLPESTQFSRGELERLLANEGRRFVRAGLSVDPRLRRWPSFRRRVSRFLGYARRRDILRQEGGNWRLLLGCEQPQMRYVLNEVLEVEQGLKV